MRGRGFTEQEGYKRGEAEDPSLMLSCGSGEGFTFTLRMTEETAARNDKLKDKKLKEQSGLRRSVGVQKIVIARSRAEATRMDCRWEPT